MGDIFIIVAKLAVVLVLVAANGFFVAAEFALVSVRRTRIDELVERGNPLAKSVQRAVRDLDRTIAASQLGITICSLALGYMGEPALGRLLEEVFGATPVGPTLALIIAFAIITSLTIIFGELAPKSVALQYPEQTSLFAAQPLEIFILIFRPAIALLNGAGRVTVRLFGIRPSAGHELVHSAEELKMLVEASGKAGALDEIERELVGRAFVLGEFQAHELMLPRTEVAAIPVSATGRDLLTLARDSGFSRFPVYEGNLDTVVGIVHVKDALGVALAGGLDDFQVTEAMRPPLLLPDTTPADTLLDNMRERGVHMACVVDEFGGLAGIVTFERVLERLVGAVRDEFEAPEAQAVAEQPDGSFMVDGLALISELNERLNLRLDESEYDTVGGLTFGLLGHKPEIGETTETRGVRLEVTELDGLRVARVRVCLNDELATG